MNGDELSWFKLAFHLHLPVVVCKSIIPISEFRDWMEYFNHVDEHEHSKIEWLLAQLCYYISTDVRLKKDVKIVDFFPKKTSQISAVDLEKERKKKIQASISNFAVIGKILEKSDGKLKVV